MQLKDRGVVIATCDIRPCLQPGAAHRARGLAANGVETIIQRHDGVTPTPVISRAILVDNRGRKAHLADGIVVTPSHNPPEDGGFTYNPTNGGPADTDVTQWVEARANALLREGTTGVKRLPFPGAMQAANTHQEDGIVPYVTDLRHVVDMDAMRAAGLTLGVAPLGGAAASSWEPISAVSHVDMTVVPPTIDPIVAGMTVDHDGQIRMDCSSPYAMARLVGLQDQYRLACANAPDADRHGIVTPTAGLMHPNHGPRWDSAGRSLWVPNDWGRVVQGSCGPSHGTDQAHRATLAGETCGSRTL